MAFIRSFIAYNSPSHQVLQKTIQICIILVNHPANVDENMISFDVVLNYIAPSKSLLNASTGRISEESGKPQKAAQKSIKEYNGAERERQRLFSRGSNADWWRLCSH